ncbi:MAG: SDR family oxidoreductase [Bacilli bacterium]
MNLFLTGATGFVGGKLVTQLLDKGHRVTLLARDVNKAERLKSRFQSEQQQHITIVQGDITEPNFGLDEAFFATHKGKYDGLYHIAALVKFDLDLRETLERINYKGTVEAAHVARLLGVQHFYHVSTAYTLGAKSHGQEQLHDIQGEFHNPYEHTKAQAEHVVMGLKNEMNVSIFRPAIIVGDSKTGEADSTFTIYGFLRALAIFKKRQERQGKLLPKYRLIGKKEATSNLVPVDYVADVLALAPERAENGKIYHITNPTAPNNERLLEMVKDIMDFQSLSIASGSNELTETEQAMNGLLQVFAPYVLNDKTFCDQNTKQYLKGTDVQHLNLSEQSLTRIFEVAIHGA